MIFFKRAFLVFEMLLFLGAIVLVIGIIGTGCLGEYPIFTFIFLLFEIIGGFISGAALIVLAFLSSAGFVCFLVLKFLAKNIPKNENLWRLKWRLSFSCLWLFWQSFTVLAKLVKEGGIYFLYTQKTKDSNAFQALGTFPKPFLLQFLRLAENLFMD